MTQPAADEALSPAATPDARKGEGATARNLMFAGAPSVAWGASIAIITADAAWLPFSGLGIAGRPAAFSLLCAAVLAVIGHVYRRRDPRLSTLAGCAGLMVLWTSGLAVLSYLCVAAAPPLIDAHLAAADRALGFDWRALYTWATAVPWRQFTLTVAYQSAMPQLLILGLIMSWLGRLERLREMVLLFMVTSLACVLLSAPIPAAGAFVANGLGGGETYVTQFMAARGGMLGAIDLAKAEGIVQFPSFHMALVVVLAWSARKMGKLSWLFFALNALMALATPPMGGHYLVDLIGGAAIAVAAIVAFRFADGRAAPLADGVSDGR